MSLFGVFEPIIRVKESDTFYAAVVKLKFVVFPKSWPWRKYQAYSI